MEEYWDKQNEEYLKKRKDQKWNENFDNNFIINLY
jgi:hypothetical protein